MNFKIQEHTLNELLSARIYCQVNKWHIEYFSSEITIEECQEILIDFDYTIDWATHEGCEEFSKHSWFFITVHNKKIIKTKLKGIPYYAFELGITEYEDQDLKDECLLNILEKETQKEQKMSKTNKKQRILK